MNKKAAKKKAAKKVATKRRYTKRNTIENLEHVAPADTKTTISELSRSASDDQEIKQLSLMCEVIESWDDDQKERCLHFIYSKYALWFN